MVAKISDYFAGTNIFITGATGFVGIALVEKFLRTIPNVGKIYLLIRPKKGKDISERLTELTKNPIFRRLIELQGEEVFSKLAAVGGDVGEEGLGLSTKDKKTLIDNVHFVFHSAATLDFEASLKATVNINLLGTRRIVQLCKEITNLKALLHVSSAYANSNRNTAEEVLYPAPYDADKAIDLASSLNDSALEEITPTILGKHPNCYTFTKALAEHEVAKSIESFPSCIIRPSMIVGAWKEPIPGWTNSKNGPQGFIMGAAKGIVRRLPVEKNLIYDYIPVDIVVNHMIAGARQAAVTRPAETLIYHCTTSVYKPFRWIEVESKVTSLLHRYPLKSAVWYPTLKLLPSLLLFKISAFIFHMIPAYILDTVTKISGGRPILVRLHTNVNRSLNRLAPFIFNEWKFDNKKSLNLHESLAPEDKEVFGLDVGSLHWETYFEDLAKGVRQYLNNESPETLPAARTKDNILMVLNWTVQAMVMCLFWFLVATVLRSTMIKTVWSLALIFLAFQYL